MKLLRIAPIAVMTVALIGCATTASVDSQDPIDNPNNEQDNPNMPYEGDQDPEAFFDGMWNVTITATVEETEAGPCGDATALLSAKDGSIMGTVMTEWGDDLAVTATVGADGVLSGGMAKGDINAGTFEGTMEATTGEGTWSDAFGCEGTFTMIKA